ncbi:sterol desaturase/sphingolipid hydroxylase (fatty acid hydroxylase superfamily) [Novosphingobium sp. GV055]|uniref:sterol desaturase family protein n=3 Tax=Novosphingobium TaxID=165696 RepID=UPI000D488DDB|nr:sterol desaturase family protein [Novosphingobium sp. GV055]PTR10417.1 sterol desaturase/sphingolipid hydroxylase (fatty acid hydroxylase superfamily) [Novosphingobium sp. GV055]PUB03088.1 sterol desaturase/sphingolipid hydroxylase (fatty acid hydroxylase superfamily) [Novosphingobium sp. GV061]PUB19749.1 sterol desaturase/sphingolipid hydroxylase (fatty acid hydroxylase superfamily) [Novosphingobium sp. GV079]PUB41388.1 sterol desaturase/sphingolipid hydroxylase (fatty acid hydroxylase supe
MLDNAWAMMSSIIKMLSSENIPQRIRLFRSDGLERLTLISWRTFALAWAMILPGIAWVAWGTASPLHALGLIGAGLLGWTLFEYAMHRFLFHWHVNVAAVQRFVFLIHGNHHDNPNDGLRDLMPLPASLPVAGVLWLAAWLAIGLAGSWLFLGFISGYVVYDTLHYACHQWPMRGRIAMALKRHHMRHHFVDGHGNYAVSAIFWDRVFATRINSLK